MEEKHVHKQANELLAKISLMAHQLDRIDAEAERELEIVRGLYSAQADPIRETIDTLEKALIKLMKTHKAEVFDGKDTVSLAHGILLYAREMKVSIPKGALEQIEEAGWSEAIRIAKSIDRAVVEKWPDERLAVIGAQKKPKETYTYELKVKS